MMAVGVYRPVAPRRKRNLCSPDGRPPLLAVPAFTCEVSSAVSNLSKSAAFHSRSSLLAEATMAAQVSKKRKFVADGVFKAELNEFLTRELAEDGYSGVEVRRPGVP
jgi:hypothetical protein